MQLKDPVAWRTTARLMSDSLALELRAYAQRWAEMMECWMAGGKKLDQIADETSMICEVDRKAGRTIGLTPDTFREAVVLLIKAWEHGEELRAWYNRKVDQARAHTQKHPEEAAAC